jgi:hypothetical protein
MEIKKLPTLFKKATTGKITQWTIEIEGNCYRTYAGYVNGVITKSEDTKCFGKNSGKANATSNEDQAFKEAEAIWTKKKDTGHFESINDVDKELYFKPMLAEKYEDRKDNISFPCAVQPKLDGIRCIIYKNNDQIIFQSRQNKLFEPFLHLLPDLEIIFKNNDLILDGELYCHGIGFEQVSSMVRRAKTRHPDIEKINYVIYDCISNESYKLRMNKLNVFMKHVFFIETIEVTTMKQIEDAHTHYTNNGYEGIMIRTNGLYKHGRSKDLLKYKKFKDSEYLVIGHTEGTGAHEGTVIFVCQVKNQSGIENENKNKTFNVVMNGPLEKRREMLQHVNDYYGKFLTVKYQELSTDGIPRFPIGLGFRID